MKFTEIPQLTSSGAYQVNVSLRYLKEKIEEEVSELNLQLSPDFQRGHVWTEDQQINYIKHLLRGGQSARVIYFNHPGWMRGYQGDFVCVDGLQRLTACLRFLNNEIKIFGKYCNEFEDKIPTDIGLIFNVNNLKTKKEVLQWYLEMNEGGTIHTEEELNKIKTMIKKEEG